MENENEVAPTSHQISTLGLAQLHAKYDKSSSPSSQSFSPVIKDYYLTDPISRASQTMARCSAAFNPNSKQPGVHNTLNDQKLAHA
jgi:NADH dehydrogenase (ubiquinone) Fe-S protein 1